MIRFLINKMLLSFSTRYGYDVEYMQYVLKTSVSAVI